MKVTIQFLLLSSLLTMSSCMMSDNGSKTSGSSAKSSLGGLAKNSSDPVKNLDDIKNEQVKDLAIVAVDKEVTDQEILDFGSKLSGSVELEKNFIVESVNNLNPANKKEMDNLASAAKSTIAVAGHELIEKSVKEMKCAAGDKSKCP